MAESWVVWGAGRISFTNRGIQFNGVLTGALDEGMKAWAKTKHGELRDFAIGG